MTKGCNLDSGECINEAEFKLLGGYTGGHPTFAIAYALIAIAKELQSIRKTLEKTDARVQARGR